MRRYATFWRKCINRTAVRTHSKGAEGLPFGKPLNSWTFTIGSLRHVRGPANPKPHATASAILVAAMALR
jgi:hypothetical protein